MSHTELVEGANFSCMENWVPFIDKLQNYEYKKSTFFLNVTRFHF